MDKKVKKSAREDKRKWMEKNAEAAKTAAESGRSKKLYHITETITEEWKREVERVKDKQDVLKRAQQKDPLEISNIFNSWFSHDVIKKSKI